MTSKGFYCAFYQTMWLICITFPYFFNFKQINSCKLKLPQIQRNFHRQCLRVCAFSHVWATDTQVLITQVPRYLIVQAKSERHTVLHVNNVLSWQNFADDNDIGIDCRPAFRCDQSWMVYLPNYHKDRSHIVN